MSRVEAAHAFMILCARHDWRFSLRDGFMHATIGDDLPLRGGGLMPQAAILDVLADFDVEIRQLLAAASGVH
jgi:hypothetical protein